MDSLADWEQNTVDIPVPVEWLKTLRATIRKHAATHNPRSRMMHAQTISTLERDIAHYALSEYTRIKNEKTRQQEQDK